MVRDVDDDIEPSSISPLFAMPIRVLHHFANRARSGFAHTAGFAAKQEIVSPRGEGSITSVSSSVPGPANHSQYLHAK